jgi:hypothetical protein
MVAIKSRRFPREIYEPRTFPCNLTQTPFFGRKVMLPSVSTRSAFTKRIRNRCAMAANNSVASIIAKPAPMQTRGPPPNGK